MLKITLPGNLWSLVDLWGSFDTTHSAISKYKVCVDGSSKLSKVGLEGEQPWILQAHPSDHALCLDSRKRSLSATLFASYPSRWGKKTIHYLF